MTQSRLSAIRRVSLGGFFGVNQNIRDFERDQYDPEYAGNWEIGYKTAS